MTAELVQLHDGLTLADIPNQLRSLADRIEAGEYGEVESLFAILPRDRDYPTIFGWGINDGAFEPIFQLELARKWLLNVAVGMPVV